MGIPQDLGITTEGEQKLSLGGDALERQRYVNIFNNDESVLQASRLTYFLTCPFGRLTKKSTCPTQSFSCPKN